MKFNAFLTNLASFMSVALLIGCGEPKCPPGYIKDGDLCRRCPRGMERVLGVCQPLAGDGGTEQGEDVGSEAMTDGGDAIDANVGSEMDANDGTSADAGEDSQASCAVANGMCSDECVPTPQGRRCACPPAHALQADRLSCRPRSWSGPVPLEGATDGAAHARIVADLDGKAAVAWEQHFGDDLYVWLSAYSPSGGWTAPEQVSGALSSSQSAKPEVQLYGGGRALVVWAQSNEIWSRRRQADGSWLPAERLTRTLLEAFTANQRGGALVISSSQYYETSDGGSVSRVSWRLDRFDETLGWGLIDLPFDARRNPEVLRATLDSFGRCTLVWSEQGGSNGASDLWAQRGRMDGTWEAPVALRNDAGIAGLRIATTGTGDNTVVTWTERDFSLWASTFSQKSGWNVAAQVARGPSEGDVSLGLEGDAILLWRSFEPIFATHHSETTSWQQEIRVSSEAGGDSNVAMFAEEDRLPRVTILPDGSAIAAWPFREDSTDYNGHHDVWSSVFLPDGGGWQTPTLLEQGSEDAREVRLASSRTGAVFAIWIQYGPNGGHLWTNRYD